MSQAAIDIDGFEKKFLDDPDPWNYANSPFEAYKRRILRQACGSRSFGRGLELACANGETSKVLSSLCLKLLALDGSPTVVAEANRRTKHLPNVTVAVANLPDDLPRQQFDLIIASEIFYYLRPLPLLRLMNGLYQNLAPSGRIVCLHHVIDFDDAATRPAHAQHMADDYFGSRCSIVLKQSHGRFAVSCFERNRR